MGILGKIAGALLLAQIAIGAAGHEAAAEGMLTAGRTSQPVGHYELCQILPKECVRNVDARRKPVELTRTLWSQMIDINNAANETIIPLTDNEIWGVEEKWSYPDNGVGDCEDYVLEKRRRLNDLGIPLSDLLITVVRQPNGDGHAVLTVRTSLGDFILDNLEPRILPWQETEYQYLKRQSEAHAGIWVSIEDGRNIAVGSVR